MYVVRGLHHACKLPSNSTYLNIGLQIKCQVEVHDEFWSNNVCWSDADKAVIGLANHTLRLLVCYADETAVLCCQCATTVQEFAMVGTNFLESEEFIGDGVIVRGLEKSKFALIFCVVFHEVWKGDTDGFAELMASVFFDTQPEYR